ncbi:MAG: IS3 family transposase [Candidatus Caenarcaniphilales bacterium]|nr:IS3 family transposase [Candidatus Caenarcaniphilales bacterium]
MTKEKLLEKDSELSIRKQTELLEASRFKFYYQKQGFSEEDISCMHEIDLIYTKYPIYGYRRIWQELLRNGYPIGRDRVLKYMQTMGIKAIFPGKKTSVPNKAHKKYPYLLRNTVIQRVNQVWSTDITYIKLESGFCYLTAVIDWYSRRILSFRISNTMSTDFCIEALEEALDKYGFPEIFNTDQGSQFTSDAFMKILQDRKIKISMDGKGRALDNIPIERF